MQIEDIPRWKKIFGFLSISGFLISTTIHLLTFFGIDASANVFSFLLVHAGLFIVWIPVIIVTQKEKNGSKMFSDIPKWAQYLMAFLFVYAVIGFAFFIYLSNGGSPHIENGQYILKSHGTIIRQLTETEYNRLSGYSLRGISGLWMFFYFMSVSFYVLKPNNKKQVLFNNP